MKETRFHHTVALAVPTRRNVKPRVSQVFTLKFVIFRPRDVQKPFVEEAVKGVMFLIILAGD